MAYNIINKTGQYEIELWEWNRNYTAGKNWDKFKPYFCTAHQELNNVAEKTVVDAGFQSENILAPVLEGLSNVLQSTGNDNEDNLI